MSNAPRLTAIIFLCLLASLGCDSSPLVAPVRGVVKFKGEVVPRATIIFHTQDAISCMTVTKEDGSYELFTRNKEKVWPGIPPGTYQVTLEAIKPSARTGRPTWLVPREYADLERGLLTREVKEGENIIDFDLPEK